MIGLILATEMEASPLVARLGAAAVEGADLPTWRFVSAEGAPEGVIVVCGMGAAGAKRGAAHLIDAWGARTVVNVGICGVLDGNWKGYSRALDGSESAQDGSESAQNASESVPKGASDGRKTARPRRGEARKALNVGGLVCISTVVDGDSLLAGRAAAPAECSLAAWPGLPRRRLASVSVPVFEHDRRETLAQHAEVVDMEGFAIAQACAGRGVEVFAIKGITDQADDTGKRDIRRNIEEVSKRLAEAVADGLAGLKSAGQSASIVGRLMNFAKIEHTLFSLPLLLAGAKLGAEAGSNGSAGAWPSLGTLGLIALAGVGARAMGMAMNRVFDRKLDAMNPRTAGRELPSGRMTVAAGLAVAAGGLGVYLLACWLLGPLCLMLSFVPAVPLVTYSLLKRFTNLCHFGIGLCLALAPMGAYVAVSGSAELTASVLLLAMFTFCWMSGFDIIYALQDIVSDRRTGVRSLPASLGPAGASAVAAGVHVVALASLAALWQATGSGWPGAAALAVTAGAFVMGNLPWIPAAKRFFPISAVASFAGSAVPLLGVFA